MGEKENQPFQLCFNASLRVDFQGSRVTSDGGLILVREWDERLGFGDLIREHLTDPGRGKDPQLPLADLLRQSVYGRLAGYEDVNDAERLSQDPTFRLIGSERIWERGAALTSRLQSFETEMLAEEENFKLRPGNVHSADGWQELLRPEIAWQQKQGKQVVFRAGPRGLPAFAKPEIYEALEERHVKYAIRIPANESLERDVACHRFRSNEVRLWLSVIAYNLGNLWRRLVLPLRVGNWSLTSLQQRLVKTGGRLIKHARYYWLLLAEGHLTRRLFGAMVRCIAALPVPTG